MANPIEDDGAIGRHQRHRRSHMIICADVIKAVSLDSLTLTAIIVHLNLNTRVARKCLMELVKSGLVDASKAEPTMYSASERGIKWLSRFRQLVQELRSETNVQ